MADDPQETGGSLMNTIRYYKSLLRFPQRNYAELEENEHKDLFFSNSKQRKDESLRMLKDWAQERMDVFERSREIVEELASQSDYRIRVSVDFFQVLYKFFNEKYFHEQQYAQFLLTKPQAALKQNHLSKGAYQPYANAVSLLEEDNLKRCERIGIFAHDINTKIIKSPLFQEFADADKRSDQLLSALIIQKKLLQSYITTAGQKLNLIMQKFPAEKRARKPIFDDAPSKDEQQPTKVDRILSNITALGGLFVGAPHITQDPVEQELQKQIDYQQQQKSVQEKIEEQFRKESEGLSSGEDSQAGEQRAEEGAQTLEEGGQNLEGRKSLERTDLEQTQVMASNQESSKQKGAAPLRNESQLFQQLEACQRQQQALDAEVQQQPQAPPTTNKLPNQENIKPDSEHTSQQQLSQAQIYKNQQKLQGSSTQRIQQENSEAQTKGQNGPSFDLYQVMISFIAAQSQSIKALNQLAQKSIAYWNLVKEIESKRSVWATDSFNIYSEGIKNAYGYQVNLPEFNIQPDAEYRLCKLLPAGCGATESTSDEEFLRSIIISPVPCQAAKILVIKGFKVLYQDRSNEVVCNLVLTIDKYVGCWYMQEEEELNDTEHPLFHYPLNGMAYQRIGPLMMDVMQQRHVLFLNIADDRHKYRLKFICADDMEEFCTIVESQR